MDKTFKFYLVALVLVLLFIVAYNSLRTKPVSWEPTYSLDNKNPLDLYVLNQEIDSFFSEYEFTRSMITPYEFLKTKKTQSNFIIVKQNAYAELDSTLLNVVENGSNLLISAENFSRPFLDALKVNYAYTDNNLLVKKADSLALSLTMSDWGTKRLLLYPVLNNFAFDSLDAKTTQILGTTIINERIEYPNFVRVKYGKGSVYLHCQPQVFSNVALLAENSSVTYVEHVLGVLPHLPTVWFVKGQAVNVQAPENTTALSVIFRYPALRMTWLIFLYGLILFVIFTAKRRQRVVPVIKPLKNTTVEFVQTIGNLYHQEGRVPNIVEKKIVYFLDKIRTKYFLDTSKLDSKFVEKLHNKSGQDLELIQSIVDFIVEFNKKGFAIEQDLIKLNNWIDEFWEERNKNNN